MGAPGVAVMTAVGIGAVSTNDWGVAVGASVVVSLAFTGSGNHRFYDPWFLILAPFVALAAVAFVWPRKVPVAEAQGLR